MYECAGCLPDVEFETLGVSFVCAMQAASCNLHQSEQPVASTATVYAHMHISYIYHRRFCVVLATGVMLHFIHVLQYTVRYRCLYKTVSTRMHIWSIFGLFQYILQYWSTTGTARTICTPVPGMIQVQGIWYPRANTATCHQIAAVAGRRSPVVALELGGIGHRCFRVDGFSNLIEVQNPANYVTDFDGCAAKIEIMLPSILRLR